MAGNDVLVIQDYESNLKIIDQIIQRLDVQPIQVLIEAVIINVELDKDKQLGVNFAVVDNLGQQLGTIGAGAAINGNVGFTPAQVLTAAGKIAAGTVRRPDRLRLGHQRHQVWVHLEQHYRLREGSRDCGQHQDPGQPAASRAQQAAGRDPARLPARVPHTVPEFHQHHPASPVPEHGNPPEVAAVRLE